MTGGPSEALEYDNASCSFGVNCKKAREKKGKRRGKEKKRGEGGKGKNKCRSSYGDQVLQLQSIEGEGKKGGKKRKKKGGRRLRRPAYDQLGQFFQTHEEKKEGKGKKGRRVQTFGQQHTNTFYYLLGEGKLWEEKKKEKREGTALDVFMDIVLYPIPLSIEKGRNGPR